MSSRLLLRSRLALYEETLGAVSLSLFLSILLAEHSLAMCHPRRESRLRFVAAGRAFPGNMQYAIHFVSTDYVSSLLSLPLCVLTLFFFFFFSEHQVNDLDPYRVLVEQAWDIFSVHSPNANAFFRFASTGFDRLLGIDPRVRTNATV